MIRQLNQITFEQQMIRDKTVLLSPKENPWLIDYCCNHYACGNYHNAYQYLVNMRDAVRELGDDELCYRLEFTMVLHMTSKYADASEDLRKIKRELQSLLNQRNNNGSKS